MRAQHNSMEALGVNPARENVNLYFVLNPTMKDHNETTSNPK